MHMYMYMSAYAYCKSLALTTVCSFETVRVHALVRVSLSMSRLCLRSIRPVRRPAQEILIMPADVSSLAQRLSAG